MSDKSNFYLLAKTELAKLSNRELGNIRESLRIIDNSSNATIIVRAINDILKGDQLGSGRVKKEGHVDEKAYSGSDGESEEMPSGRQIFDRVFFSMHDIYIISMHALAEFGYNVFDIRLLLNDLYRFHTISVDEFKLANQAIRDKMRFFYDRIFTTANGFNVAKMAEYGFTSITIYDFLSEVLRISVISQPEYDFAIKSIMMYIERSGK